MTRMTLRETNALLVAFRAVADYFGDGPLIVENGIITRPEPPDFDEAQALIEVEREAAEAAPSPDTDRVERLLSFYERFVPHAVQSEYREVREDVIDAIAAYPPKKPKKLTPEEVASYRRHALTSRDPLIVANARETLEKLGIPVEESA